MCCAQAAHLRGIAYHLVAPARDMHSTRVSAGIMNPITGRKYALQWAYPKLHASADTLYTSIANRFDKIVHSPTEIFKMHKSEEALEAWLTVAEKHSDHTYVQAHSTPMHWQKHLDFRFGAIQVTNAMRIDSAALCAVMYSDAHKEYIDATIDISSIQFSDEEIHWNGERYKHIIFCDGVQVLQNPFFNYLPLKPAKGEALIAHIPYLQAPVMLQKQVFAVPLGGDLYWIGATNDFNEPFTPASDAGRMELEAGLRDMVKLSYTVEAHRSGVRPSMRDRVPVVGAHPAYKHMFTLNGLGTKGAMLAPYYAGILIDYIFNHGIIPDQANVARFAALYSKN